MFKTILIRALGVVLAVAGLIGASSAHAATASCAAPCTTGNVAVNFSITIPSTLRLTIGTAAAASVAWSVPAANIGDSTAQTPTVTNGGNANTALVNYSVFSNRNANVSVSAVDSLGNTGLVSGANTIPYADITAVATGALSAPAVGGVAQTLTPASGVVNVSGTWAFSYANTANPPAGTYTSTVNYTATQP